MTFHLASFLLGLAALPCLLLLALVVLRLVEKVTSPRRASELGSAPASRFEPLRFTPRLIGQLRRPLDAEEDQAHAS